MESKKGEWHYLNTKRVFVIGEGARLHYGGVNGFFYIQEMSGLHGVRLLGQYSATLLQEVQILPLFTGMYPPTIKHVSRTKRSDQSFYKRDEFSDYKGSFVRN